ncbi:bifunctional metallophosphatase/5'-nucleotidase [Macrococcoides caseolyticum]|uniref:bifunctional metallophosphatase/5'-nucleotidase n=1 Tax=Macrococcoides caseolyticum TaxID=69966 RepID=UPI001F178157|nr:bifunctional UDP-sugar hydrolase/5'-nucleotidase [Macrococcus caseolyticus]MCE4955796.1 bifunctional metallophosphatase/5'-nucleotidase [Macrococcus caseolyticus]
MEIKIFHTNDIHSYLSNYKKLTRYILDRKSESVNTLYFDLGDHVDRSHPYTEATLGQGNVQLLNEARVDVVTIGNNEGITLTYDDFNRLYDQAQFKVTCCNLFDEHGQLPKHIDKHVIFEKEGITFGLIGATAEFTPFYKALGWVVCDPMQMISDEIQTIRDKVDVLIILSHLGKFFDRTLAESHPEIDLILGAHTHHAFENGEEVNGVLIGAAGRYGEYLGEITLTFNGHMLTHKKARLINSDDIRNIEDDYYQQGKRLLNEVIADTWIDLPRRLYSAAYTTYILADKLMHFTKSDCALINTGLIVNGYHGAAFTKYDLHKMLPHPINPVRITLTGRELKEVINESTQHAYKNEIVKGFGFRGDIFGMYVLHNLGYIQSQQRYFIGTEEIDNHRTYQLATLDMYTFGRFFPQFVQNEKEYYMPEFLRDLMYTAIQNNEYKFTD